MNKLLPILFVFLSFSFCSKGQTAIVKGKITDSESGEALTGVNVATENGRGVATDESGKYSLSLKEGIYKLTFSYIGYQKVIRTVEL